MRHAKNHRWTEEPWTVVATAPDWRSLYGYSGSLESPTAVKTWQKLWIAAQDQLGRGLPPIDPAHVPGYRELRANPSPVSAAAAAAPTVAAPTVAAPTVAPAAAAAAPAAPPPPRQSAIRRRRQSCLRLHRQSQARPWR